MAPVTRAPGSKDRIAQAYSRETTTARQLKRAEANLASDAPKLQEARSAVGWGDYLNPFSTSPEELKRDDLKAAVKEDKTAIESLRGQLNVDRANLVETVSAEVDDAELKQLIAKAEALKGLIASLEPVRDSVDAHQRAENKGSKKARPLVITLTWTTGSAAQNNEASGPRPRGNGLPAAEDYNQLAQQVDMALTFANTHSFDQLANALPAMYLQLGERLETANREALARAETISASLAE